MRAQMRHIDLVLDQLELLNLQRRHRIPGRLLTELARIRLELDETGRAVPRTCLGAHRWLLDLQGRRLMRTLREPRQRGPRSRSFVCPHTGWRTPPPAQPFEDYLDRLFNRWAWANERARRERTSLALDVAAAAWEDYFRATSTVEAAGVAA